MSEIFKATLYEAGDGGDGIPRVVFENDEGDKIIIITSRDRVQSLANGFFKEHKITIKSEANNG